MAKCNQLTYLPFKGLIAVLFRRAAVTQNLTLLHLYLLTAMMADHKGYCWSITNS